MAAKLRASTVSLHTSSHYQTKGAQASVPCSTSGQGLVRSAKELQTCSCTSLWVVWQRTRLWAHHFLPVTEPLQVPLCLHVTMFPTISGYTLFACSVLFLTICRLHLIYMWSSVFSTICRLHFMNTEVTRMTICQ